MWYPSMYFWMLTEIIRFPITNLHIRRSIDLLYWLAAITNTQAEYLSREITHRVIIKILLSELCLQLMLWAQAVYRNITFIVKIIRRVEVEPMMFSWQKEKDRTEGQAVRIKLGIVTQKVIEFILLTMYNKTSKKHTSLSHLKSIKML